jgi:hypothetical protein
VGLVKITMMIKMFIANKELLHFNVKRYRIWVLDEEHSVGLRCVVYVYIFT